LDDPGSIALVSYTSGARSSQNWQWVIGQDENVVIGDGISGSIVLALVGTCIEVLRPVMFDFIILYLLKLCYTYFFPWAHVEIYEHIES
jgi:hypothetical protein